MEHTDYRLAAILFTDIVGFSRMMEEDEKGTLKTLDFHDALVREQVSRHRGTVIKTIGDAFLAQFNTTLDAVSCALDIQTEIQKYNEADLGKPLTLRIGVHMGDIYFYENDALGEGINIASRLQSITKPGHITISREVFSQVSGKIPMRVESLGQVHLKNISREVHGYEIIPGGEDNNSIAYQKKHQGAVGEPQAAPPKTGESEVPPRSVPPEDRSRPSAPPSFKELKDEWRSLKDHIKREVRESMENDENDWRESWKQKKRELRAHRRGHGFQDQVGDFVEDLIDEKLSPQTDAQGNPLSAYQVYKKKELRTIATQQAGMRGHLSAYVMVNGALFAIWLATGASGFPWPLMVLGGWGIGILSHVAGFFSGKKKKRELEAVEDLNDQDYKTLKKHQQARSGFAGHLVSNLAVVGFLFMLWKILGGFPWPLIVAAAMGIGVFSHWGSYSAKNRQFKDFWKAIKKDGFSAKGATTTVPGEDPVVTKARKLRDSILTQAQGMKGGNPFGEDMGLTLDNYVKQIGELSTIEREIGSIVRSFNATEMEAEAEVLRKKRDSASSETLRQEYDKSLSEMEKQSKSFKDLAEQQEILSLRLASAVKNLQQMQIDLARIKSLSDGQKEGYFVTLKDRSAELSRYIEDYREGLEEAR